MYMKPPKQGHPPKIVQRLTFSMDKLSLQRVIKETSKDEDLKISFGIDYQQKIWVEASSPDGAVGPAPFAQQLSFSVPRNLAVNVLSEVRDGCMVKISLCICTDQKVWISLSDDPNDAVGKGKK
jgi:hypothetical protein